MYECQARMRQDAGILQTISIYILLSSAVIKSDREREETMKRRGEDNKDRHKEHVA